MLKKRKKRRRLRKGRIALAVIFFVLLLFGVGSCIGHFSNKIFKSSKGISLNVKSIKKEFFPYGKVNKGSGIYFFSNDKYKKIGSFDSEIELSIEKGNDTEYFKISNFDEEYYVFYKDISKIDSLSSNDSRYKNYIPFNENIVTNDKTSFYDNNGNLLYSFNKSFDLPVIIKRQDKYGVEFNKQLVYVSSKDVKEIINNHNTDDVNTPYIGALNYHFFWDEEKEKSSDCDQEICLSKSQFKKQLDLFKEMNLFTLTMDEVSMYIDGEVQLPKSVLITIDDGWRSDIGVEVLNEYKMNGTLFLITSYRTPDYYSNIDNKYVEFHSHTHNMHNGGKCPGGQGGEIKCLPYDDIISDLKKSREILNNPIAFCFPFYEYNDSAIKAVKDAGFEMAFIGESSVRDNHIKVGSNKYKLPRFVVVNYTTFNDLRKFLK